MEDWDAKKKLRVFRMIVELNLPKTGWALDFGCGSGVWTAVIKKALPAWKVFGADISSQAISNAKRRFPHLNFFELSNMNESQYNEKFDFLFSHHVLEHVFDINETWNTMNRLLKKTADMLHILPCGNADSFEYNISLLVKNGIDERGRFFYEDPGHLRRLNTEGMNLMAGKYGFRLSKALYSFHYWTAIDGITRNGPSLVLRVANPKKGKNKESEIELRRLRSRLLPISILRLPAVLIEGRIILGRSKLLTACLYLFPAMIYPFSFPINLYINSKAEQEWNLCKNLENGGEMYLFYDRASK